MTEPDKVLQILSFSIRRFSFFVLMTASLAGLSGCGTALLASTSGTAQNLNLTDRSYSAADMLIQQSRNILKQDQPLEIGLLVNMDNPVEVTNFSHVITNQIASRFVQLGYHVISDQTMAANQIPGFASSSHSGVYHSNVNNDVAMNMIHQAPSGAPTAITPSAFGDNGTPMPVLKPVIAERKTKPYAQITGRYAVARRDVLMHLQIVESGTGRVLASYDYTIPYTNDIRELTKTKRVKDGVFDF
jgi:hypothetical protein